MSEALGKEERGGEMKTLRLSAGLEDLTGIEAVVAHVGDAAEENGVPGGEEIKKVVSAINRVLEQGIICQNDILFANLPFNGDHRILTIPVVRDYIARYGGKNFGNLLIRIFHEVDKRAANDNEDIRKSREVFSGVGANDVFYVSTDYCHKLEKLILFPEEGRRGEMSMIEELHARIMLDGSGGEWEEDFYEANMKSANAKAKLQGVNPDNDKEFLNHIRLDESVLRGYVENILLKRSDVVAVVTRIYEEMVKVFPGFNEKALLFRGSLESEDWYDESLAGVSPSGHWNGGNREWAISILSTYVKFLWEKALACYLDDERVVENNAVRDYLKKCKKYDYKKDEKLGLQVVPKIDWRNHFVCVCDEEGTVRMDVRLDKNISRNRDLVMRITVSKSGEIESQEGFSLTAAEKEGLEKALGGEIESAFYSREQVLALAKIVRRSKELVGFGLDREFAVDKEGRLYDFQSRPMPAWLKKQEEEPQPSGYKEVLKTPFAVGERGVVEGQLVYFPNLYTAIVERDGIDQRGVKIFLQKLDEMGIKLQECIFVVDPMSGVNSKFLRLLQIICMREGRKIGGVVCLEEGVDLTHSGVSDGYTYFQKQQAPTASVVKEVGVVKDLLVYRKKDVRLCGTSEVEDFDPGGEDTLVDKEAARGIVADGLKDLEKTPFFTSRRMRMAFNGGGCTFYELKEAA